MEPWGTTEGFTQPPLTWSSGILWDGKAFATWDMSQELRGLSHPCCCLRRELGNPLLWVWDICPGFFCRLCDCLRKCSCGALHQLTTPAAEKEQLCAHSSARSAQREVSSLALPQGALPLGCLPPVLPHCCPCKALQEHSATPRSTTLRQQSSAPQPHLPMYGEKSVKRLPGCSPGFQFMTLPAPWSQGGQGCMAQRVKRGTEQPGSTPAPADSTSLREFLLSPTLIRP